ncbi:hypothetical protein ANFP_31470 [Acidithiobacillus ferrooxidans]|nr:hypothetical protein ANFP_31470 [Acidithiobacillus ferrooxidans]
MFYARPHFGDFMVAPLLAFGQWVVAAAFPLDTTPVALGLELFFPLLTGVASIRIHFGTGIPVIQYNFKVPAVVDRGRVGHQLADQFVFAIYSDRDVMDASPYRTGSGVLQKGVPA